MACAIFRDCKFADPADLPKAPRKLEPIVQRLRITVLIQRPVPIYLKETDEWDGLNERSYRPTLLIIEADEMWIRTTL